MGYIESFEEIMATENRMLRYCIDFLREHCSDLLTLLDCTLPQIEEIPQIPFASAKEWIANSCKRKITDMLDFEPEEERLLCELVKEDGQRAWSFVTHYPSDKTPVLCDG